MRDIRRALGDDPESPSFIETIPRRGYRFLDTVRPSRPSRSLARWAVAAAAGLTGLTTWGLWVHSPIDKKNVTNFQSSSVERAFRQVRALADEPGYAPLYRVRALLTVALDEFPRSALAHAEAAHTDFMLGNHTAARRHVDRALELEPFSARAYTTKAAIALYWDGDEDAAKRYITNARLLSPNDADVLLASGFIAAALGDVRAAQAYARRLADRPTSPATRVRLGYLHYVLGQFGEMEKQCHSALTSTRRIVEPQRCRLFARLAQDDESGAASIAQTILGGSSSRNPAVTLSRFWIRELENARRVGRGPRGVAHFQAAQALAQMGNVDSAIMELLRAVESRPVALAHVGQFKSFASLQGDPRFEDLRSRRHQPAPDK